MDAMKEALALLEAARAMVAPAPTPPADAAACARAAAVSDDTGRIHAAATIISRAPGASVCALRIALGQARADGSGKVRAVLALWPREAQTPCGLCRQALLELAPDAALFVAGGDGVPRPSSSAALLPRPFLHFDPETTD